MRETARNERRHSQWRIQEVGEAESATGYSLNITTGWRTVECEYARWQTQFNRTGAIRDSSSLWQVKDAVQQYSESENAKNVSAFFCWNKSFASVDEQMSQGHSRSTQYNAKWCDVQPTVASDACCNPVLKPVWR